MTMTTISTWLDHSLLSRVIEQLFRHDATDVVIRRGRTLDDEREVQMEVTLPSRCVEIVQKAVEIGAGRSFTWTVLKSLTPRASRAIAML